MPNLVPVLVAFRRQQEITTGYVLDVTSSSDRLEDETMRLTDALGVLLDPVPLDKMVHSGFVGVPSVPPSFLEEMQDAEEVGPDTSIRGIATVEFQDGTHVAYPEDEDRTDPYISFVAPVQVLRNGTVMVEFSLGQIDSTGDRSSEGGRPTLRTRSCEIKLDNDLKPACFTHSCPRPCRPRFKRNTKTGVRTIAGCRCPSF